ncbi:MAG: CheB methylesterase domain-containing protein [Anaerotignaceae bacterium]
MNEILFLSNSIVYKGIIEKIFSEISPSIKVICKPKNENYIDSRKTYDLLIFDYTSIEDKYELEIKKHISINPKIEVIVLDKNSKLQNDCARITEETGHKIDLIYKPISKTYDENYKELRKGIRLHMLKMKEYNNLLVEEVPKKSNIISNFDLMVIASSTGGPRALETVISGLNKKLNIPILIVQHMPKGFTANLANTLNKIYAGNVYESEDGLSIESGNIYIAKGGYHTVVDSQKKLRLNCEPMINGVRPSADVLFNSVAKVFVNKNVLAIVLTGMGSDGANGVLQLKKVCNCVCITQNEESCIIYGMPKAIVEANLADKILSLSNISGGILRTLEERLNG